MSAATVMTDRRADRDAGPLRLALPVFALVVLIAVAGPLFVRMPLTNDTELYDLQADVVCHGGVLYRDLLEPNLPGVVWCHLIVRGALGDSSEAMRVFDLLVLAGSVTLAGTLLRLGGSSWPATVWTAFGLTACYLSQSEWCHCQRDGWMLCPALAAIVLHVWNLRHQIKARSAGRRIAFAEGVCWGLAVWLKPYVVVPAAFVWAVSLARTTERRSLLLQAGVTFCGGLLVGMAGIAWMIWSGCWPYFLETVREWNPQYFAAGRANWTWFRAVLMAYRFAPWILLHGIACVLIAAAVIRWRLDTCDGKSHVATSPVFALVAAAYLGWTTQALLCQHQFDYVFSPTVLLALLVVALHAVTNAADPPRMPFGWLALGLAVLVSSPWTQSQRLHAWPQCVRGPNSPELQDRLAHFQNPNRRDLQRLANYLEAAGVARHDVCCYNSDFVSLYRRLSLAPPTRYTYLFETLQFFPDRRQAVLETVQQTPHRFVITDLVSCGLSRRQAEEVGPAGPHAPPPAYRLAPRGIYPWNLPVVFRAGTYLVHQVGDTPIESSMAKLP